MSRILVVLMGLLVMGALFLPASPAEAHGWLFCDPGRANTFASRGGGKVVDPTTGQQWVDGVKTTIEPFQGYLESGSGNNETAQLSAGVDRVFFGVSNGPDGANRIFSHWEINGGQAWENHFFGTATVAHEYRISASGFANNTMTFDFYIDGAYTGYRVQILDFSPTVAAVQAEMTANIGDEFPQNIVHYEQDNGWYHRYGFGNWNTFTYLEQGYYVWNDAPGQLAIGGGLQSLDADDLGC